MSLIAITLGQQSFIPPVGEIYPQDSDVYRPAKALPEKKTQNAIVDSKVNKVEIEASKKKALDHMIATKDANVSKILRAIADGYATQRNIHRHTKIARATICDRLREMVEQKLVIVDADFPRTYSISGA